MKILLLGARGSGKTTLIHAMYGHFQEARNGFRLNALGQHGELLAGFRGIQRGVFPEASKRRWQYDMVLQYNGYSVLHLSLVDYQGGVYQDDWNGRHDLENLAADMQDADAAIGVFDSAFYGSRDRYFADTIQAINEVLMRTTRFFPICFVVTKSDLRRPALTAHELQKPLSRVIDTASKNPSLCGALFDVACGRRFKNVDLPLMFTVLVCLASKHVADVRSLERRQFALSRQSLVSLLVDFISSRIDGRPTEFESVSRLRRELEDLSQIRKSASLAILPSLERAIVFPDPEALVRTSFV